MKIFLSILLAVFVGLISLEPYSSFIFFNLFVLFLLSRKSFLAYLYIFILIFFVPDEVLFFYTNNQPEYGFAWMRVHPVVVIVIVYSIMQLYVYAPRIKTFILGDLWMRRNAFILAFFLILSLAQTLLFRGIQGLTILAENFLAPTLLMFCVYLDATSKSAIQRKYYFINLYRIFVLMICLCSIYGIFEYLSKENIIYGAALSQLSWGDMLAYKESYRAGSFFGHPLKASYYYLFGFINGILLFPFPANILIAALSATALLFAGSRAGLALVAFSALGIGLIKDMKVGRKIFVVMIAVLLIAVLILATPFAKGVILRIKTEGASTFVRMASIQYMLGLIGDRFFVGRGLGSSMDMSKQAVGTSFENPWLMMLADVGLVTTFLYLLFVFRVFLKARKFIDYKYLTGLILFLSMTSFSSLGVRSTLNFIFLFNLGIMMAGQKSKNVDAVIGVV